MRSGNRVLVGVDGSAQSDAAVVWAASEAGSRKAELSLVYACDSRYLGIWTMSRAFRDELREYGRPIVDHAFGLAATIIAPESIQTGILVAPPGRTLALLSGQSELVVIGRTGRGALSRLVFGSTTREVMAQAHCPVVAVDEVTAAAGQAAARVVVAIRNAAANTHALRFAFDYAQRHQAELQVVRSIPASLGATRPSSLPDDVSGWTASYPSVETTVTDLADSPIDLAANCKSDDLLVIGHHRPHAWNRQALGAHLLEMLHAAPCPVAVVPEYATTSTNPLPALRT